MKHQEKAGRIISNINQVLMGKEDVVTLAVMALLARGHILIEDVPGVGKTTLAHAMARSVDVGYTRIQFTPDTLPSDVVGSSIYNLQSGSFEFMPGAIMDNIILVDEINRTSPKTQAALLEAMEERQVTVDRHTYPLADPFMVIATQNPIEFVGTYHLPEAQLDRFLMKVSIGYPSPEEECKLSRQRLKSNPLIDMKAVINKEELLAMQAEVEAINLSEELIRYIVAITSATREHASLALGASPRATIALTNIARACAYVHGRSYVIPDDIKSLIPHVLGHRLMLTVEARMSKKQVADLLEEIVRKTSVPISAS